MLPKADETRSVRDLRVEAHLRRRREPGAAPLPLLTVGVVFTARTRLKEGPAPGADQVAIEMIKVLPAMADHDIHDLFRYGALGKKTH